MTIRESLKRINDMIDAYTIAKRCGCQIDIPIDEDLEALTVARDFLDSLDKEIKENIFVIIAEDTEEGDENEQKRRIN